MDNHLGSEHPTECIASDILWLNRRGEDVVLPHCPCVCSRQVVKDDGLGSEETQWVRVSNVVSSLLQMSISFKKACLYILSFRKSLSLSLPALFSGRLTAGHSFLLPLQILDSCMECVINDVGEEIVHGPQNEEEEAELAAALSKWPMGDLYALCVGCGSGLCSKCMGPGKYFPNAIETDNVVGAGRTGFQVKPESHFRYFVCHDCADDKERYVCCFVCMVLSLYAFLVYDYTMHVQAEVFMGHPQLSEATAYSQPSVHVEDVYNNAAPSP